MNQHDVNKLLPNWIVSNRNQKDLAKWMSKDLKIGTFNECLLMVKECKKKNEITIKREIRLRKDSERQNEVMLYARKKLISFKNCSSINDEKNLTNKRLASTFRAVQKKITYIENKYHTYLYIDLQILIATALYAELEDINNNFILAHDSLIGAYWAAYAKVSKDY